jgi:hypothetical protein
MFDVNKVPVFVGESDQHVVFCGCVAISQVNFRRECARKYYPDALQSSLIPVLECCARLFPFEVVHKACLTIKKCHERKTAWPNNGTPPMLGRTVPVLS